MSGARHPRAILAAVVAAVSLVACGPSSGTIQDVDDEPRPPTPSGRSLDTPLARRVEAYLAGSPDPVAARVRAVLVSVDGDLVMQRYRGSSPAERTDVGSIATSLICVLVGIALDRGLIEGIDQPLDELLPERAAQMSPAVAEITLADLLTMRSGLPDEQPRQASAWASGSDPVGEILRSSPLEPPGDYVTYSLRAAHLLAAVLAESTGMPVLEFARQALLDPMGMDTAAVTWAADRQGVNLGHGGLQLTPFELLQVGELLLEDGEWRGRQLVPRSWVRASVSSDQRVTFGRTWWLFRTNGNPAFAAAGADGQLLEVVPDLNMVVVVATAPGAGDTVVDGPEDSIRGLISSVIIPGLG